MGKRIVYTRPDGGVSVVVPAPGVDMAVVRAKDVPPDATNVMEVADTVIPTDREFRDAWEIVGRKIVPNLAKSKAIQEGRIRAAKIRKARELLERETAGEDVSAEKAELQKIDPPAIVAPAATVAEIKALWPAGLSQ